MLAIDNLTAAHAPAGWQRLSRLSQMRLLSPQGQLRLLRTDLFDLFDLFEPSQILPLPDCVFHLAAQPGVRSSESLDFYLQANLQTTEALLDGLCQRQTQGARYSGSKALPVVVFASSSSVYGDIKGKTAATENDLCQPRSVYGQSKWYCEKYLAEAAFQRGFKAVALRLFSVYGPDQRPDMAFQRWTQAILTQQPLILHDPQQMSRDFTCVADVVQAFLQAADYAQKMPTPYACFNVGSGVQTPLQAAAELWIHQLEQAAGKSLNARIESRSAHRAEVFHTWANLALSQRLLGYQPRYTLATGMADFARHVLNAS